MQIVIERFCRHAERATGDNGFGAEFGGSLPHCATFSMTAEVEKDMAEAEGRVAVRGTSFKPTLQGDDCLHAVGKIVRGRIVFGSATRGRFPR
jgi:hypothetical protein